MEGIEMNSSKIAPEVLIQKLKWPVGKVRVVLDTDTYNEVDDQFALAYATCRWKNHCFVESPKIAFKKAM
jgi:hypothetical protein